MHVWCFGRGVPGLGGEAGDGGSPSVLSAQRRWPSFPAWVCECARPRPTINSHDGLFRGLADYGISAGGFDGDGANSSAATAEP